MPKGRKPKAPKTWPKTSYSVIAPGGRNQDRKANQAARVSRGDRAVNTEVANSYNHMYKTPRTRMEVAVDKSGGTFVRKKRK